MATQTDRSEEFDMMMEQAKRQWHNCISTTTKLKFEQLRDRYHLKMQDLLTEIRKEKSFRTEQCRKFFE